MFGAHQKTDALAAGREFLAFEDVSIRRGETIVFKGTSWTWRGGEQWAILGQDGSGKTLLVEAILGRAMIAQGELRGPIPREDPGDAFVAPITALVSPQTQRETALREGSFYQLRWHSGLEHGSRTVAEFLSQESVEERNPFEIGLRTGSQRGFGRLRSQFMDWLGITGLRHRRMIQLSNGEMRKTLLVHALLKNPDLLILEDPYAGLDVVTRHKLGEVISRLMRNAWPVLVATDRAEEIPQAATHILIIDNYKVVAQGPKQEMLALWRGRNGTLRRRSSRIPQQALLTPNRNRALPGKSLVELNHVRVAGAKREILHDITWTLREGERWALLGPNGAGKTALLNLIQGDHPQVYSEDIRLFGRRTDSTQALWRARQNIGWMSPELHQHYSPDWEIEEVVCSGFFNSIGLHQPCTRRQQQTARQWIAGLGLAPHRHSSFGELSFGEQRLVLLARAAVKRPRLLILDEPCQGLDSAQRARLLGAVDRLAARRPLSLVFVTHHKDEVPRCITHILRLNAGRIREARPQSGRRRTRGLLLGCQTETPHR